MDIEWEIQEIKYEIEDLKKKNKEIEETISTIDQTLIELRDDIEEIEQKLPKMKRIIETRLERIDPNIREFVEEHRETFEKIFDVIGKTTEKNTKIKIVESDLMIEPKPQIEIVISIESILSGEELADNQIALTEKILETIKGTPLEKRIWISVEANR